MVVFKRKSHYLTTKNDIVSFCRVGYAGDNFVRYTGDTISMAQTQCKWGWGFFFNEMDLQANNACKKEIHLFRVRFFSNYYRIKYNLNAYVSFGINIERNLLCTQCLLGRLMTKALKFIFKQTLQN